MIFHKRKNIEYLFYKIPYNINISYWIFDKTANAIYYKLKLTFQCFCYPCEIGSDHGSEFMNLMI